MIAKVIGCGEIRHDRPQMAVCQCRSRLSPLLSGHALYLSEQKQVMPPCWLLQLSALDGGVAPQEALDQPEALLPFVPVQVRPALMQ